MAERNTPRNAAELLKTLHEFVLESEEEDITSLPPEKVQAALQAEGMDPTPLVRHVREGLSKMRAQEELSRARTERHQLLDACSRIANSLQALPHE